MLCLQKTVSNTQAVSFNVKHHRQHKYWAT